MDRVADATKQANKFGSGKHGYTEGDQNVVKPTVVRATALDSFQEEIVRAIEGTGLTPDGSNLAQLYQAVRRDCAQYAVTGTAVNRGSLLTLTQTFADPAYALASNVITVALAGRYKVSLRAPVKNSNTTNPQDFGAYVDDGTTAWPIWATRFSATAADYVHAAGQVIVSLAAGGTIQLGSDGPVASNTTTSGGWLTVELLHAT